MSLFLKIFLWFWGAMTVLVLSLILILGTLPDETPPRSATISSILFRYGYPSIAAFLRGGDPGLRTFLQNTERQTGVKFYLFDPSCRARGLKEGTQAPDDIQALAQNTLDSIRNTPDNPSQLQITPLRLSASLPIATSRGIFVVTGSVSRSLIAFRSINTRTKILSLSFIFLTSGLFCYGLARYLAAPVGRIRRAAQRLSSGDLNARVEPNHVPRGRDEIAYLAHDFDLMAERMQSLVTAQNRLLSDVSHELRSPLARMSLALELARRGDELKKQNAMERIAREAIRLDVLIGELLTLSRLENGLRAETLNNAVDIASVVCGVEADAEFESQNAGRGVKVTYSGPEEGITMRGNPELLHRAVENVTRNALRHTNDDSTVAIELHSEGSDIVITISDGGPGVPPDELESIFRPFYRVEGARDRPDGGSGTGLGLAIAQRAIAAHGGTISASNRSEGGLCVRLSLPKNRVLTKNEKSLVAV
ncbi:sensor histidine kinase CpxA [Abditibacteriota bacterium]|nr:sensor histidine kinase CpxA [Abditibacteriota bacterium]